MRHLREIEADPALRAYGVSIATGHALAFAYWYFSQNAARLLAPGATPVCWPFFESCHAVRVFPRVVVQGALFVYLALAVGAGIAFAARRMRLGAFMLGATAVVHVAFVLMDYRLRLNQHLMLAWVGAVFLLAPRKRTTLRALLAAFYVWAGLLKLNTEWLSGEALLGQLPLMVPASVLPLACAYVVVLELVVVFGLFSSSAAVFWGALAQLVVFHVASFSIVGFFYPLLMLSLLSIFVFARMWDGPSATGFAPLVVVGSFSALQLVPHLFPGDPALTGQGRWLALHMFDAPVACRAVATVHTVGKPPTAMTMTSHLPARIACDPIVYFGFARAICRERAGDPAFDDFDLLLESRRGRKGALVRVIDIRRFCASGTTYDVLTPNAWIRGE